MDWRLHMRRKRVVRASYGRARGRVKCWSDLADGDSLVGWKYRKARKVAEEGRSGGDEVREFSGLLKETGYVRR